MVSAFCDVGVVAESVNKSGGDNGLVLQYYNTLRRMYESTVPSEMM